jgi:LPXTG-motif cell wall-anchored protein
MVKKVVVLCLAALGAALLVVGVAPTASAYPDLSCEVTVDHQTLRPGESFTVTGENKVAIDSVGNPVPDSAVHWTFNWNGVTKARTGKLVHASFTAPEVSRTRVIPLTARSTSPAGQCVRHLDIKVLGTSVSPPTGGGGHLPSTGGPAFWLLLAAVALLLVGGGTVLRTRRRG